MKIGKEETMWVAYHEKNDFIDYATMSIRDDYGVIERIGLDRDTIEDLGWRIKKVKVLITEIE